MRYNHVLFDLDGTLCDPGPGITDSVAFALEQMGIVEADAEVLRSPRDHPARLQRGTTHRARLRRVDAKL